MAQGTGWLTSKIQEFDSKNWSIACQNLEWDLPLEKSDTLKAYFVVVSLSSPDEDSRKLVSLYYDNISSKLQNNSLPIVAKRTSETQLPYRFLEILMG